MPDGKKKKKGLLTIPPELQEYISNKSRGIKQFAPEMEEWSQISPEKTWEYWRQTDPEKLYMIQLRDLLWELYQPYLTGEAGDALLDENGKEFEDKDVYNSRTDETTTITARKQAENRIKEIINEAETKMASDFYPLESLPYYEETRDVKGGLNFNREYQDMLVDEMGKAQQLAETRQTMLNNVGSEKGRKALQEYITYGEKQRLQDKLNKGEITQEDAYAQIKELEKQAYGEGSAFEKWQHELAGDTGVPKYPGDQGRKAQEAGAKRATDLQTQQMKQSRLLGMLYPEQLARYQAELRAGWGQAAGSGSEALGRGRFVIPAGGEEGTAESGGGIGGVGGSFTGTGGGGTYIPPNFYIQGFANWAQTNPEFQKARATKEVQMWTDFPSTYPAYLSYMQSYKPTGLEGEDEGRSYFERGMPLTFEKWGQEDVEGKLLSEAEETRKRAASLAAKGRLAPLTVNR